MTAVDTISHLYLPLSLSMGEVAAVSLSSGVLMLSHIYARGRLHCSFRSSLMPIKFAAIGLNHSHIYGQVDCLLREGAEFVAFHAPEDFLAEPFGQKYPQARRVADRARHPRGPVHCGWC